MLKRSDLAKQFELVVKQEVINHNNQMLATNLALNSMRESVELLMRSENKSKSDKNSDSGLLNERLDELSKHIKLVEQKLDSLANDQRDLNARNAVQLQDIFENLEVMYKKHATYDKKIQDCNSKAHEIGEAIKDTISQVVDMLNTQDRRLDKTLEKFKEEIKEKPKHIEILQNEVEEKIYSHKVDVEGIMLEINVFKKMMFIFEKKLENAYTQIDRLKGV